VGIFRKKTLDEIGEETDQYGTHKLITLKSRFQGRDSSGHNIFVKKPDGGLCHNFINFECANFDVKEKGSAEGMYLELAANQSNQQAIEMPSPEDRAAETPSRDVSPF
jgi:hypothetical protein